MKSVFLTGYEGETIEEFIDKLTVADIKTIIDVREIPLSRKNGFSGIHLEKILSEKGIKYYHFQELGSPTGVRTELKKEGEYFEFFTAYRKYIRGKEDVVEDLLDVVNNNKHPALLCFEKECQLCHRSIIADELVKLSPKLQVIPL